ncbi:hypothetical protein LEP3755_14110 [Leptolyngbya sp. NIES-3755]|nr:hypothetical protein LEP3755_14110 [Leptolyngbya sp. NIES-3755]
MKNYMTQTIAIGFTGMSLTIAGTVFSPAHAAQQLSCTGRKSNGWSYNAKFVDGRFTQITWNRAGQPPQVSPLTFFRTNAQGEPVYRGSFQGATAVTLVDLGQGNVRPGSQISVGVEEWGWSRGTCAIATGGGGSTDWFSDIQLMMIGNEQWREAMRAQGFIFDRTVQHTNTQIVERWTRPSDRATVDVVLVNKQVTDVRRVN